MIRSFFAGTLLTIVTIFLHAGGTAYLIRFLKYQAQKHKSRIGEFRVLSTTAVALLFIHTLEVMIWAAAYFILVGNDKFGDFETAVYFSTVTFTSLGYGDIVIEGPWRMLSAFQVMTGILIFGWSTALFFTVVQRIWQKSKNE